MMDWETNVSLPAALQSLEVAYVCVARNNKGRAFAHFLVALTVCPELRERNLEMFVQLSDDIGDSLIKEERVKDFFKCFEEALRLYPNCAKLKRIFAKHLLSVNLPFRAFSFYRAAYMMEPDIPLWQRELDEIKNTLVSRWHYKMLNDGVRNNAFKEAILSKISPQHSVLDIGCGTGLLSLFASQARAQKIVAVDSSETLTNVSTAVFKDNDVTCTLLNKMSTDLNSTEIEGLVSAVVTETFDAGFFGEGILQTMVHARKHLMRNLSTDVVIPKSGTLYICAVQSNSLAKKHIFLDNCLKDSINFNGVSVYKNSQEPYDSEDLTLFRDLTYITDVVKFLEVDLYNSATMEALLNGYLGIDDVTLKVNKDGHIHAYVVWFDLHLTETISLTTDPRAPDRARAWDQAIFYLNRPLPVKKGAEISVQLSCNGGKLELVKIDSNRDCFPMESNIIRCLNDSTLVNSCNTAASAACVHFTQACTQNHIEILDLSPFPITGFLLLARGIEHLTCVAETDIQKQLILRICELNGIAVERLHFYTKYDDVLENDNRRYHLIVNNFINEAFGELNIKHIVMARGMRSNKLMMNGLLMPHKVRMMAKIIYSEEFERLNRVNNANVMNYNIAEYMNIYSVGQDFVSDVSMLPYTSMSKDVVLLENVSKRLGNSTVDVELLQDGPMNAVMCWFEIQMMENGETFSTNIPESWSASAFHLLEADLVGVARQNGSILMVCDEKGYLRIAVDF